ncbi:MULTISPECIES: acyl carrier protein [Cyanophyceae]|uniref:acyl carrier protein n=1 Tax=Cyanophyceae TaxID=3028117 RepID=UPI0016891295|nr:acyl carrier protein [Trichocoleus sp. FACHB-69]MBD1930351.1 acyl carrier protein [Trichocoleus sp. FACHB-69]
MSAEDIQAWLISKISEEFELDPDGIDIYEPFACYGLTSMTAVSLSGDLENWLQIKLSPTLTWDYPTIETLAQYLDGKVNVSVLNPKLKVNVNRGRW